MDVDQVQKMDRMYRWTRHVYDLTRRYYLLGRDRMLREVATRPAGHVVEVGCGTARNLKRLYAHAPQHTLYGIDASHEMLDTARQNLASTGADVRLTQGLAEDLTRETLGRTGGFDVLFFSYVLSMIPTWKDAVDAAVESARPGGTIYVVDFWDQGDLPSGFASLLQGWLSLFDVHHRPELLAYLRALDADGTGTLTLEPVARRYAYVARLQLPSA